MDYSISQIDDSGLMNVTLSADWLRFGMGAHNIEANSILYHTLQQGLVLSRALNDSSTTDLYASVAETIKNSANALLWNETAGFYNDNETSTLHPQDGNSWAVVANLTDSPEKIARISANLQERWGPYGAPAPEAGTAVSPFIGGFELQTHFAAGNATRALELMRLQWGYMLDGPHMTNSTFIEGYEFSGALHYAPYPNDVRISHAHGWSTGPTSTLTFNVAGIVLESAGGASWLMKPQLGDLELVHAGFSTGLGLFENRYERQDNGSFKMVFQAPRGTKGKVSLENQSCAGTIVLTNLDGTGGNTFIHVRGDDENARIELADIVGGRWELNFTCSGLVTEERQKFRAA